MNTTRLDEAAVQKVIARALQLDAERSAGLARAEVLAIGSELGISHEAVQAALDEYEAGRGVRVAEQPKRPFFTRGRVVIATVVCTVALAAFAVAATRLVVPVRVPAPEYVPAPPPVTPTPPAPPAPPAPPKPLS